MLRLTPRKRALNLLALYPLDKGAVAAGAFADAGAFDLDDFCAHVGQYHGTEGAGHDVGNVQDADAGQRERQFAGFSRHGRP